MNCRPINTVVRALVALVVCSGIGDHSKPQSCGFMGPNLSNFLVLMQPQSKGTKVPSSWGDLSVSMQEKSWIKTLDHHLDLSRGKCAPFHLSLMFAREVLLPCQLLSRGAKHLSKDCGRWMSDANWHHGQKGLVDVGPLRRWKIYLCLALLSSADWSRGSHDPVNK